MAVLEANFGKVSEVTLIQSDYVSRIASLTQDNLKISVGSFTSGAIDTDGLYGVCRRADSGGVS